MQEMKSLLIASDYVIIILLIAIDERYLNRRKMDKISCHFFVLKYTELIRRLTGQFKNTLKLFVRI